MLQKIEKKFGMRSEHVDWYKSSSAPSLVISVTDHWWTRIQITWLTCHAGMTVQICHLEKNAGLADSHEVSV